MQPENKSNKKMGIIIGIIIVVIVGLTAFLSGKKTALTNSAEGTSNDTLQKTSDTNSVGTVPVPTTNQTNNPKSTTTTPPPVDTIKKTVYKNGTYTANGTYMSPGGADNLDVTLILTNDVVVDASVVIHPGDETSDKFMNKFVSGYKQYVVGKNISDLKLTKVSGSSLTPMGFNDALAKIKAQAKS